jgi:hypothetical protein
VEIIISVRADRSVGECKNFYIPNYIKGEKKDATWGELKVTIARHGGYIFYSGKSE